VTALYGTVRQHIAAGRQSLTEELSRTMSRQDLRPPMVADLIQRVERTLRWDPHGDTTLGDWLGKLREAEQLLAAVELDLDQALAAWADARAGGGGMARALNYTHKAASRLESKPYRHALAPAADRSQGLPLRLAQSEELIIQAVELHADTRSAITSLDTAQEPDVGPIVQRFGRLKATEEQILRLIGDLAPEKLPSEPLERWPLQAAIMRELAETYEQAQRRISEQPDLSERRFEALMALQFELRSLVARLDPDDSFGQRRRVAARTGGNQ
jgi:hypothetical protein